MAVTSRALQPWTSGLCSCLEDCSICCYGLWCRPCLYGENYAAIHQGSDCCGPCMLYTFCAQFACCFATLTRRNLRHEHDLMEAPCTDCCVHCWCSACGLCQEAREIKARGVAPSGALTAGSPAHYPTVAPAEQRVLV